MSSPQTLRLLSVAVLALLSVGLLAPTARAETTYRYWAYTPAEGAAWTVAATGLGEVDPQEGSVQGMRFAVHGLDAETPRVDPDFETVCAGTEPTEDGERIAVVVDPGTTQDAVEGETPGPVTGTCVLAGAEDSAQDVLAEVAELRTGDGGLVCALDGYPATGCGDPADPSEPSDDAPVELQLQPPVGFPAGAAVSPSPTASEDPGAQADDAGSTGALTAVVAVAAVVVIGAGLAVASARRRRHT